MSLIPHRFLFRIAHPCLYASKMPLPKDDRLLDLPSGHRIDNFAGMDEQRNFAELSLAWNELGLGLQLEVRGKQQLPVGNLDRPRASDGVSLWLDTRDARTSHRAGRYCHQFHFLATGAGPGFDEPAVIQTKINRALEDAPMAPRGSIMVKVHSRKAGYILEAFIPAAALNGYDPNEHRRLGFFADVRDDEMGSQLSNLSPEFPFWEDPSLWSTLELVR
ncbi:MAG: hypothetical protein HYX68_20700 [Planctomycetes bacterium]|nr:hypothetical protein [Planctomycetota bacterium]